LQNCRVPSRRFGAIPKIHSDRIFRSDRPGNSRRSPFTCNLTGIAPLIPKLGTSRVQTPKRHILDKHNHPCTSNHAPRDNGATPVSAWLPPRTSFRHETARDRTCTVIGPKPGNSISQPSTPKTVICPIGRGPSLSIRVIHVIHFMISGGYTRDAPSAATHHVRVATFNIGVTLTDFSDFVTVIFCCRLQL